jgi:hypothetical protein
MDLFMNTMEFPLWLAIFTWVLLLYFIANSYYWSTRAMQAEEILGLILRFDGEEE